MIYLQKEPSKKLSSIIRSFWMVDSESDAKITKEKIIPDGFPEMIFDYKQPSRTNINGSWLVHETPYIMAGQIRNFFFLENTGETGSFAIKFQPWAFKLLFNIYMKDLTDNVISIPNLLKKKLEPLIDIGISNASFDQKVIKTEKWLLDYIYTGNDNDHKGINVCSYILEKNGQVNISDLLKEFNLTERSLERFFQHYIGVSPKFYCRIIRFANIFNHVKNHPINWTEVAALTGFYDQAHFIKNFKEFTGEDPSKYGFSEKNMANLFLNR